MIRISKLTDYGFVLLTYLAKDEQASWSARQLADESDIPLPTVGKLLKLLQKGELLSSQRGSSGGYRLIRPARDISAAEVIELLEGPVAITECNAPGGLCDRTKGCPARGNWRKVNAVVLGALQGVTLADLARVEGGRR